LKWNSGIFMERLRKTT